MAVDVICFWSTLINYARKEAKARKEGTPEELERAIAEHEAYRRLCLNADSMILDTDLRNVL